MLAKVIYVYNNIVQQYNEYGCIVSTSNTNSSKFSQPTWFYRISDHWSVDDVQLYR